MLVSSDTSGHETGSGRSGRYGPDEWSAQDGSSIGVGQPERPCLFPTAVPSPSCSLQDRKEQETGQRPRLPCPQTGGRKRATEAGANRHASEQVTERRPGIHRRNGSARVVPDVPGHDGARAAGPRGRHLERVLEVRHR